MARSRSSSTVAYAELCMYFGLTKLPMNTSGKEQAKEKLSMTSQRENGDGSQKLAVEWNLQGSPSQGRPRTTWKRSMVEEAKKMGRLCGEIKTLANNKVSYRQFVEALLMKWWDCIYCSGFWLKSQEGKKFLN